MVTSFEITQWGRNDEPKDKVVDEVGDAATKKRMDTTAEVHHQLLRELANNFKLGENRLETGYGSFKITPRKIGHALGINATGNLFPQKVEYKKLSEDDKIIFRRFQGKTLKSLTDEMMDIGVGNEEERLMFKRIFILYIQMAFLLPTTINKISSVHLAPIF
ncbi:uncharacterized protein LOC110266045 [Arachis ipaensis]|uniref:uncharacterized protein LOC110266045 n=1 Tax=Arachis ipaensis TaxID=130454 RepID=UPI000A2B168F|nr:uncharacterized protein LOC110266045 [Arachis ipaensis]